MAGSGAVQSQLSPGQNGGVQHRRGDVQQLRKEKGDHNAADLFLVEARGRRGGFRRVFTSLSKSDTGYALEAVLDG